MRLKKFLLGSLAYATNSDYDPEYDPNEVGAKPIMSQQFLNSHDDLTFAEFEKLWPQLRIDNNWYGKY